MEEEYKAEVLPFDVDLHKEILAFNKNFTDWVEEETRKQAEGIELISGPLQKTIDNADINSLSREALNLYISKTKKNFTVDSDALINDLISKGLLASDEKKGMLRPTGDCLLLFGKDPRDKFPQAAVKARVEYTNGEEQDAESFNDALVLLPEKVIDWARKVIP